MRLRSDCTSHKRTTHRALRLALAMALVGGSSFARAADELRPACAAPLNHPDHVEAGLLPYPFAQARTASQAKQSENVLRLVRLVGLQHESSAPARCTHTSREAQPLLPPIEMRPIELGPMMPSVVAASATGTEALSPKSEMSNAPALAPAIRLPQFAQPPRLPQPPALPAAPDMPAFPASSGLAGSADSLTESLIDIEIPMDVAQVATAPSGTSIDVARDQDLLSVGPQIAARGPNVGLVHATQPPLLLSAAAESISPPIGPQSGVSSSVVQAHRSRMPELVQASKSMSITKSKPSSPSVSLNLSDSPIAESTSTQAAESGNGLGLASAAGDRGVSLHLSSASQVPMKTTSTIQLPKRAPGMQVRVEGEPAQLITAGAVRGSDKFQPVAPRPSMESAPRMAVRAPSKPVDSVKKVKASFASRTTQLTDREPLPLAEMHEQRSSQRGETLSVGLQESQAMSSEFAIIELSVEHPAICQLMQTGEKSVSLIGMRPGSTRIALVTVNNDGERQVELHEVSVGTSAPTELSLPDLAKEVSRTVATMVPHSDVQVVAYEDYLVVHGFTPYESDAKKILSVVRKTSLVPVVDQLKTNER